MNGSISLWDACKMPYTSMVGRGIMVAFNFSLELQIDIVSACIVLHLKPSSLALPVLVHLEQDSSLTPLLMQ